MVDPITLGLLAYAAVMVIAYIAVSLQEVVAWFKTRNAIKAKNKDVVAFTLAQKINGKNYVEVPGVFSGAASTQVVQGLFNTATNELLDGRLMKSNKFTDADVVSLHDQGEGLVLYA